MAAGRDSAYHCRDKADFGPWTVSRVPNGLARTDLKHLDLAGLDRSSGATLGRQLAELHRHAGDPFGWQGDNWIGDTPHQNGWQPEWPLFFARNRLLPQLHRAAGNGMERKLVEGGEALAGRLAAFFVDYHPSPSLLHGDLWSGNAAALSDGTPVIFDPAAYYGDREADLAMSELFGGFPESFYAAYRLAWPLDAGYETRKTLYDLYHVLNHYNLFGAGYPNQVRRMIDRLAGAPIATVASSVVEHRCILRFEEALCPSCHAVVNEEVSLLVERTQKPLVEPAHEDVFDVLLNPTAHASTFRLPRSELNIHHLAARCTTMAD